MNHKLLIVALAVPLWVVSTLAQESNVPSQPQTDDRTWTMFNDRPWPDADLKSALSQVCGLPFDDSVTPQSTEALVIEATVKRLTQGRTSLSSTVPIVIAPVRGDIVNAWTFSNVGERHAALICLPAGMRQIVKDAPQELASIIAHEMGHAVDRECWNYKQRSIQGQRSCESRADSFGLAIAIRAGYNPLAFAGAFGRLEMISGQTDTGLMARLANAISSNHPITPDRIEHLHEMLVAALQGRFIQQSNEIAVPPARP